jgi:hypothetical protein
MIFMTEIIPKPIFCRAVLQAAFFENAEGIDANCDA